jgi:hypothetical protein
MAMPMPVPNAAIPIAQPRTQTSLQNLSTWSKKLPLDLKSSRILR